MKHFNLPNQIKNQLILSSHYFNLFYLFKAKHLLYKTCNVRSSLTLELRSQTSMQDYLNTIRYLTVRQLLAFLRIKYGKRLRSRRNYVILFQNNGKTTMFLSGCGSANLLSYCRSIVAPYNINKNRPNLCGARRSSAQLSLFCWACPSSSSIHQRNSCASAICEWYDRGKTTNHSRRSPFYWNIEHEFRNQPINDDEPCVLGFIPFQPSFSRANLSINWLAGHRTAHRSQWVSNNTSTGNVHRFSTLGNTKFLVWYGTPVGKFAFQVTEIFREAVHHLFNG